MEVLDIVPEAVTKTILEEKEMKNGKIVARGGITNSYENKRSERQMRKGKIYPSECRIPKNSKERGESLLK